MWAEWLNKRVFDHYRLIQNPYLNHSIKSTTKSFFNHIQKSVEGKKKYTKYYGNLAKHTKYGVWEKKVEWFVFKWVISDSFKRGKCSENTIQSPKKSQKKKNVMGREKLTTAFFFLIGLRTSFPPTKKYVILKNTVVNQLSFAFKIEIVKQLSRIRITELVIISFFLKNQNSMFQTTRVEKFFLFDKIWF